jgi:hypothetical protein
VIYTRVEKVYDKLYIYLDKLYADCDYNDKKSIGEFIRDYLVHYNKYLDLFGFYKVKAYCNKQVGLFLEIINIDKSSCNELDLRILVFLDEEIFICYDDYFLLNRDCYFYNGKFYTDVVDKVNLLDFVDYIYGDKVLDVKNRGIYIKKESN